MNQNKFSSISDLPYEEARNDFGTDRYVDGLVKFIELSSTPITIAIQGEWGSGKTSLMNRLATKLCGKEGKFKGIAINTWEYSMLSNPEETVFKIIEKLVRDLSAQDDLKPLEKYFSLKKTLYRVGREGMKSLFPGAGVLVEAFVKQDLDDYKGKEEKEVKEKTPPTTLTDLKDALEESVRQIIQNSGKGGVIIFVDDLDRLNPPVAVEILELLKNIFSLKGCIFILAIDYDVVVKGLEPKFGPLTDKNEREFRSFFDKIIQVPFSLPVSSYRPMEFVLKSMEQIGYFTEEEIYSRKDGLIDSLTEIIENSVGKNPRSIKRLINTLSLISCIDECGTERSPFSLSIQGRIITIVIVAIQVVYPKIYRLFAKVPNFTQWDADLLKSLNFVPNNISKSLEGKSDEGNKEKGESWQEIIEEVCGSDQFLNSHYNNIVRLLDLIEKNLETYQESLPEKEREAFNYTLALAPLIDKSSTTSISVETKREPLDRKRLIGNLYTLIGDKFTKERPDIKIWKWKRNTGNGGVNVWKTEDEFLFDVDFRPSEKNDSTVSLQIVLSTGLVKSTNLMNKTYEEILRDKEIKEMLEAYNRQVAPLFEHEFFKGQCYDYWGHPGDFKNFIEEQIFRTETGIKRNNFLTDNEEYYITLPTERNYNDKEVGDILTTLIVANHDLRLAYKNYLLRIENE